MTGRHGADLKGTVPFGLRLGALAHHRSERAVVLSLAEELVENGASTTREAASLVTAGLAARLHLHGAPWREALAQLALPIAALILAAFTLGATRGPGWIGWSWTAGLTGVVLVLAGHTFGRRRFALPGALLVLALCSLDAYRDYGRFGGTQWQGLFIDVLPALTPLALVLVAAGAQPRRQGLRALAWALTAAAALTALAAAIDFHTTKATTVVAAGGALVAAFVVRALRGGATARLAGAIALTAAAGPVAWCVTASAPEALPDQATLAIELALALGALTGALRLAGA